jgi:hypothetical protein
MIYDIHILCDSILLSILQFKKLKEMINVWEEMITVWGDRYV